MRFPQIRLARVVRSIVDGPFGSSLTSSHYTDEGARVIRLGNIGLGTFKDDKKAYISEEHFADLARHEVKPGDVLVAGLGDEQNPLGRACLAPDGLGPAIVKADCFRMRLDEERLDPRFAVFFLCSTLGAWRIEQESRGATRSRATPDAITSVQMPLPPLAEQRRIAAFLTEQVGVLERAEKLRQRQLTLLSERASVEVSQALSQPGDTRLPLRHLTNEIVVGIVVQPAKWYTEDSDGVPVVRALDVSAGRINTAKLLRMTREGHELHPRSQLREGDVMVIRTGDAGVASLIPSELVGANCISNVIVRVKDPLTPLYLEMYLNSYEVRSLIDQESVGAIQRHFGVEAMKRVPIPLLASRTDYEERAQRAAMLRDQNELASSLLARSAELLQERKRALITAAVSGDFDVTTARRVAA